MPSDQQPSRDQKAGASNPRSEQDSGTTSVFGESLPLDSEGELLLTDDLSQLAAGLSSQAEMLGERARRWRENGSRDFAASGDTSESPVPPQTAHVGSRLVALGALVGTVAGTMAMGWLMVLTLTTPSRPASTDPVRERISEQRAIATQSNTETSRNDNPPLNSDLTPVPPAAVSLTPDSLTTGPADRLDRTAMHSESERQPRSESTGKSWNPNSGPYVSHPSGPRAIPVKHEASAGRGEHEERPVEELLEGLSAPELEGWLDLQQQRQVKPPQISI